jgi:DNA polymerase III subunit delta'
MRIFSLDLPALDGGPLALRLAQALNCERPIMAGEPCFVCRTCKQIEAMQHPDLSVIQAWMATIFQKKAASLKVDQIREMQRTLNLKPYQSKYRVVIFLRFQEAK